MTLKMASGCAGVGGQVGCVAFGFFTDVGKFCIWEEIINGASSEHFYNS